MPALAILERAIHALRGRHFPGKGRLLRLLSPTTGERTISIAPGTRISLRLDDHLQRLMYMDILHHDWLPILPALLRPGGTFVDIGANIGYFTLLAAGLVGTGGRVVAIEPIPRTGERLRANIALNGFTQVRVEHCALGAAAGTLELHLPPPEVHRDYLVTGLAIPGWQALTVPCTTLDEAFAAWQLPAIDLMKIDVEGGEPQVIRGGRSVLASGRVRALVCEISGVHLAQAGLTPDSFADDLATLGFRHARLGRDGRITPQPLPRMRPDRDYNLLFIHQAPEPARAGTA
jgi:FkbM family methyltransferase